MSVILEYYAPVFSLFSFFSTAIFVPRAVQGVVLVWAGLAFFSTAALLVSEVFHLFHYERVMPFILFGAPLWRLCLIPAVMLFTFIFPKGRMVVFPYLVGFAVVGWKLTGSQPGRDLLMTIGRLLPFSLFRLVLSASPPLPVLAEEKPCLALKKRLQKKIEAANRQNQRPNQSARRNGVFYADGTKANTGNIHGGIGVGLNGCRHEPGEESGPYFSISFGPETWRRSCSWRIIKSGRIPQGFPAAFRIDWKGRRSQFRTPVT